MMHDVQDTSGYLRRTDCLEPTPLSDLSASQHEKAVIRPLYERQPWRIRRHIFVGSYAVILWTDRVGILVGHVVQRRTLDRTQWGNDRG